MLQTKKAHKFTGALFRVIKILIILILVVAIFFGGFELWRLWPQIRFKYGYLISSSLIKPIGNEDNTTKLTTMLSEADIPVVAFEEINNDSVIASLSGDVRATFSLTKDLSSQVATLQVILGRFRIEGRKVHRIDLRFNNAVVE